MFFSKSDFSIFEEERFSCVWVIFLCLVKKNLILFKKITSVSGKIAHNLFWATLTSISSWLLQSFCKRFLRTHTVQKSLLYHASETLKEQERTLWIFGGFQFACKVYCLCHHMTGCVWVTVLYCVCLLVWNTGEQRHHSVKRFNIPWWCESQQCVKISRKLIWLEC